MPSDTIGILAGMGPRSTAPFIDLIVAECQRQCGAKNDIDFPPMMIYSLPTPFYVDRPIDHGAMRGTICAGLQRLAATDVAFIAMPCNSAHIYYDQLTRCVGVPLLNMVEIAIHAIPASASRIALLATRSTVSAGLYQPAIADGGRECVTHERIQQRVDRLIQTIKTSPDHHPASELWNDLMDELERERADTALIACTDLNVVSASYRGPMTLLDATHCLAAEVIRRWRAIRDHEA
jgi:aspartate racemase